MVHIKFSFNISLFCFGLLLIIAPCTYSQTNNSTPTEKIDEYLEKAYASERSEEAIPFLDSAAKIYKNQEDKVGVIDILIQKSYFLVTDGDYTNALANLNLALKKSNDTISYVHYDLLNALGELYLDLESFEKAHKFFNRSQKIAFLLKDDELELVSKVGLGNTYLEQTKYSNAIFCFEEVLSKIDNKAGSEYLSAVVKNNLGYTLYKIGDFEKALGYALESLKEHKRNNSGSISIINTLHTIGMSYMGLNELEKSEEYLYNALDLSKKNKYLLQEISCLNGISILKEKQNKSDEALIYYKDYIKAKDSLFGPDLVKRIKDIEAKERLSSLISINKVQKRKFQHFLILGGIFIIMIFFFLFAYFQRHRRVVAENKKQILEAELFALRTQMNPHFIFNTINSLQNLVLNSDKYEAYSYLTKFSQSIRLILENSRQTFIELDNELKLIQTYINLQQLRFQNKIDYEEIINFDLLKRNVKIPSLILQPIIENALVHGILSKPKGGKIILRIVEQDNYLVCIIEDNGIGRIASAETKESELHLSLSTENIESRIKLLVTKGYVQTNIEVEDLYKDNKPCGTRITLKLPIK